MTNAFRHAWSVAPLAVVILFAVVIGPTAKGQAPPATQPTTRPADTAAALTTGPASTQPADTQPTTRPAAEKISMNFEGASLDAVLDHLSAAAGFIVIKE